MALRWYEEIGLAKSARTSDLTVILGELLFQSLLSLERLHRDTLIFGAILSDDRQLILDLLLQILLLLHEHLLALPKPAGEGDSGEN